MILEELVDMSNMQFFHCNYHVSPDCLELYSLVKKTGKLKESF